MSFGNSSMLLLNSGLASRNTHRATISPQALVVLRRKLSEVTSAMSLFEPWAEKVFLLLDGGPFRNQTKYLIGDDPNAIPSEANSLEGLSISDPVPITILKQVDRRP